MHQLKQGFYYNTDTRSLILSGHIGVGSVHNYYANNDAVQWAGSLHWTGLESSFRQKPFANNYQVNYWNNPGMIKVHSELKTQGTWGWQGNSIISQ